MTSSSLRRSERAARGRPQFATGPQKCVLKKYSRDAGERNQVKNVEAILEARLLVGLGVVQGKLRFVT